MYRPYVPNKTISLPDDVLPIIATLDVPFSQWVAEQLRVYAARRPRLTLGDQVLADTSLAEQRPDEAVLAAVLDRMNRTAPW